MATLTQYWSQEVTRIGAALGTAQAELNSLRAAVPAAESAQRNTADTVRAKSEAVAAARRALALIAMPADGDPLLADMEAALVALRAAQAALAEGEYQLLRLRAELQAGEQAVQRLSAELAAATATLAQETRAADARQALAERFGPAGNLANLVSDALAALAAHKATALARVHGEFPTSAAAESNFLVRVGKRAQLVRDIAASAVGIEQAADAASSPAVAVARRNFDAAVAALQATADAASQVAADTTTLARLAALPAANPPNSYSILSRWQHDRLHDAGKKAKRESALAKLTAVDDARQALIAPQVAYTQALHAALQAEPDKTVAQLDATTLAAQRAALDAALATLAAARADYAALSAADRRKLDEWFAAVPDALWDALAALDGAVGRLERISGSPTPADRVLAIDAAESALETALRAARAAERQKLGGQLAAQAAGALLRRERDSSAGRATAMARSSALF